MLRCGNPFASSSFDSEITNALEYLIYSPILALLYFISAFINISLPRVIQELIVLLFIELKIQEILFFSAFFIAASV